MWKKVERNNNYSVNEKGQVRNDITGRLKKPFVNPRNGYLTVDLYKNNKSCKVPVHRLVAEAFITNPENKPTVDHKDGNRQNNSVKNLRWATYSEQNSRFNTTGVRSEKIKVTHYGETRHKSGWGHISWDDITEVRYFNKIGDAAEYFNVSRGNISHMLKSGAIGKRGKMRGYLFEYCNRKGRVTTIETKRGC